ncbi:helix-turn-helix transcriptional regulator [Microlunatus speluncae]|uniref:helix-turn-helix transcriptional regulator n=1 Tax=Microlunatus speluncae TaxID=2594267 RepID=UPI001375D82A|nr:LuxR family transcriptional regulator [Microlunatus speluncae]
MLIGRGAEQRAVDTLLADATVSRGGALLLTGEAGIGKTRLLEYATERATAFRLLRVTGTELERDLPFAGLAGLLRPVLDRLDRLPEPQAEALGIALALRRGGSIDRFAVCAGVLTLVTQAAEEGPIGLVVDDLHLVDRASAEAVAFTGRRLLADPVFVLAASRTEDQPPWSPDDLPRLPLSGLDAAAAADLAEATAPAPLTGARRDRVIRIAGGNPLAIRELARDPAGIDDQPGDFPLPLPVPAVIAETFGRRLSDLSPDDRSVLLLAAVTDGDLDLIARVCAGTGQDLGAIERAEAAGLVSTTGTRIVFQHSLMRSAVYAAATGAERRRTHRLVAAALPAGDHDLRAWQLSASTLGTAEPVARAMAAVGRRAADRGAYAVAAGAYARAASLSPGHQDRGERYLRGAEAAWSAGDDRLTVELAGRAVRHDRSASLVAWAEGLAGLATARGGSLRAAHALLVGAADAARDRAPDEALVLYADAVEVSFMLLDIAGAGAAADRIERLLAARDGGPDQQADQDLVAERAAAVAWIALGMARIVAGRPGAAMLRSGVDRLAALGDANDALLAWDVLGPLFLRESDAGRDLVAHAVDRRRRASAIGALPHLLWHLARDDATTDRWTRAEAGYGEAVALAREFGQATELGAALAGLSWLAARMGRSEESDRHGAEARQLAATHDLHMATAWTRFGRAELELSQGRTETAIASFRALDSWLRERGVLDVDLSPVPELVEALCRTGRPAEAAAIAPDYLAGAERKGQPWSLARAVRVRALLAAPAELTGLLARALELHGRTLDRYEEARTRLVVGQLLRRNRRRAAARDQLRVALQTFERLGAPLWADVALAELNATGVTVHRRDLGPVLELTARELQIALLLADGRTTREAAAALFLSPKTVEYHLRHVYTKLGIASRGELRDQIRLRTP